MYYCFVNTKFQGSADDVDFTTTDFYDCLDKCKNNENCKWISYSEDGTCFLFYEDCTVGPDDNFLTTTTDCTSSGKSNEENVSMYSVAEGGFFQKVRFVLPNLQKKIFQKKLS